MADSAIRSVIGVISGTSMDGIDVALIETDGLAHVKPKGGATYPYPAALKAALLDLLREPSLAERDALTELEESVTDAFTACVAQFMRDRALSPDDIDLVGLHGQTVYHRPEKRFTRQLGLGQRMADRLGVAVVYDFRTRDVQSGGQGAPLVPLYHAAIAHGLPQPVMLLNLGGVGNVTYLDGDAVIAFDTGPASALMDDLVREKFGLPFDEGGLLAAKGKVDDDILSQMMANPFFAAPVPKSLDRNDFHARAKIVRTLSDHDALATLAAFTVEATAAALAHVPGKPLRWLVAGGGRHNAGLMRGLAKRLDVPVDPIEVLGLDGDLTEAECFGYLAVRSMLGLPLSLPTTTGVPLPTTGGRLARPNST